MNPVFILCVFVHFVQSGQDVKANFDCNFVFAQELVSFYLKVKTLFVAEFELQTIYSEWSGCYIVIMYKIELVLYFWYSFTEMELLAYHDFSFNITLIVYVFSFVFHGYKIDFECKVLFKNWVLTSLHLSKPSCS